MTQRPPIRYCKTSDVNIRLAAVMLSGSWHGSGMSAISSAEPRTQAPVAPWAKCCALWPKRAALQHIYCRAGHSLARDVSYTVSRLPKRATVIGSGGKPRGPGLLSCKASSRTSPRRRTHQIVLSELAQVGMIRRSDRRQARSFPSGTADRLV